jgi:hypothetical protein
MTSERNVGKTGEQKITLVYEQARKHFQISDGPSVIGVECNFTHYGAGRTDISFRLYKEPYPNTLSWSGQGGIVEFNGLPGEVWDGPKFERTIRAAGQVMHSAEGRDFIDVNLNCPKWLNERLSKISDEQLERVIQGVKPVEVTSVFSRVQEHFIVPQESKDGPKGGIRVEYAMTVYGDRKTEVSFRLYRESSPNELSWSGRNGVLDLIGLSSEWGEPRLKMAIKAILPVMESVAKDRDKLVFYCPGWLNKMVGEIKQEEAAQEAKPVELRGKKKANSTWVFLSMIRDEWIPW